MLWPSVLSGSKRSIHAPPQNRAHYSNMIERITPNRVMQCAGSSEHMLLNKPAYLQLEMLVKSWRVSLGRMRQSRIN